jgi:hypothetical protein
MLAKGKTMMCTEKFSTPSPHIAYYSETGWMREDTMLHYIEFIVVPYLNHRPGALILDTYRAHITPVVREKASQHRIQLICVPSSMTSTLAPLDVGINGPYKSSYTSKWKHIQLFTDAATPTTALRYATAVQLACKCYNKISVHTIKSSFINAINLPPTSNQMHATRNKIAPILAAHSKIDAIYADYLSYVHSQT